DGRNGSHVLSPKRTSSAPVYMTGSRHASPIAGFKVRCSTWNICRTWLFRSNNTTYNILRHRQEPSRRLTDTHRIDPLMPRSAPNPAQPAADGPTVAFVSLGCPKNLVDSEKMLGLLAQNGIAPVAYDAAEAGAEVDTIVVNTCGFLEASKEES